MIIIKDLTIKNIRKAMRNISNNDYTTVLLIPGWGQIKKIGKSYSIGPLPEEDDSDIMTDCSAWNYGLKESWVLEYIAKDLSL